MKIHYIPNFVAQFKESIQSLNQGSLFGDMNHHGHGSNQGYKRNQQCTDACQKDPSIPSKFLDRWRRSLEGHPLANLIISIQVLKIAIGQERFHGDTIKISWKWVLRYFLGYTLSNANRGFV